MFCIIFTFQYIYVSLLTDIFVLQIYRPSSYQHVLEPMLISLSGSLPVMILVRSETSRIPPYVHWIAHALLTLVLVCGLLIYLGWVDFSIWLIIPAIGFISVYIPSVFFVKRYLHEQKKAQQNSADREQLLHRIDELMHQYTAMRKFKHDQCNIFSSMDIFATDENWVGMKHYYNDKIKPAFAVITEGDFALESLTRINIQEVKSILTIKLSMAQNLGINTTFEADAAIDDIPIDSITIVRMLGILLDNAIEELSTLKMGTLFVACFKKNGSTNFIVQNTCRPNIPSLRTLRQPGFSTKGKGRGLGLDTLFELTDSLPNLTVLTSVKDEMFTQKLMIASEV
ncbi:MAG: GHKL domain-containing protein [Oscillospiraceae bacterium]|nr:GHKL domain-containing protein [Oscillospiraceae bacterium]